MLPISQLWHRLDQESWTHALQGYWQYVRPANLKLEQSLDQLDINRVRNLDQNGWYTFLRDEYYRWKYTAPNRYATTTNSLSGYITTEDGIETLYDIKAQILEMAPKDVRQGLQAACKIKGLGTAGAAGLLSLLYPAVYGTVDQFVVKALREVDDLPESPLLAKMKPTALSVANGVTLIAIMTRKANELNCAFGNQLWTPRRIDQVLWTYGR